MTNKKIDKISRDFFWKKYDDIKGLSIVSWDKNFQHKRLGGLGLRKMEAFNGTFLWKLTWKLFHDESLWLEQMSAKYRLIQTFSRWTQNQPTHRC